MDIFFFLMARVFFASHYFSVFYVDTGLCIFTRINIRICLFLMVVVFFASHYFSVRNCL